MLFLLVLAGPLVVAFVASTQKYHSGGLVEVCFCLTVFQLNQTKWRRDHPFALSRHSVIFLSAVVLEAPNSLITFPL